MIPSKESKYENSNWKWFGLPGHFICGDKCRFHLCTQVGNYLVSTIGQLWPERKSREISAKIDDPKWFEENQHLKGDNFDYAYMVKFGYMDVGCNRKFETMVFKAGMVCKVKDCNCDQPTIDGSELDFKNYNNVGDATKGHMLLCNKWSKKK